MSNGASDFLFVNRHYCHLLHWRSGSTTAHRPAHVPTGPIYYYNSSPPSLPACDVAGVGGGWRCCYAPQRRIGAHRS
ncbi:unnamed protein product [Pleuronectes platessa]|uniref:Uncharacterized protein n=1 Tax=Pleuronectes platessa TaxID=8262 RepID=A0A9N7Z021_PLEPL|nr:unnamed protein product [Pleuronectes platessa]